MCNLKDGDYFPWTDLCIDVPSADLVLEMQAKEFFHHIGMLVIDGRTPQLSDKGRVEGPHCLPLSGHKCHVCDPSKDDNVSSFIISAMYQCKVDVDMLNTVKSLLADISSICPLSEQSFSLLWWRANAQNVSQHSLYCVQHIHINLMLIHCTFYRHADADADQN